MSCHPNLPSINMVICPAIGCGKAYDTRQGLKLHLQTLNPKTGNPMCEPLARLLGNHIWKQVLAHYVNKKEGAPVPDLSPYYRRPQRNQNQCQADHANPNCPLDHICHYCLARCGSHQKLINHYIQLSDCTKKKRDR